MQRALAALSCLMLLQAAPLAAQEAADVLLRNAIIHDGSASPGVVGDVAFRGGRIVGVGRFDGPARQTIDCTGQIVCPGFIDLHNHSDTQIVAAPTRANLNYLRQGCTTIITGNCGAGPVNVGAYLAKVDLHGAGTNVGHLLPQGALRELVVGLDDRKARPEELQEMQRLIDLGMQQGAWGISTGLIYVPSSYATTAELTALAAVSARRGGLYVSHIRGEGVELLASVEEVLTIARSANAAAHISHFKCSGRDAWGLASRALALVEQGRARGLRVTADQYPYIASSTSLEATVVPAWARAGGSRKLLERWDDPQTGRTIASEIEEEIRQKDDGHAVRLARFAPRPEWIGLSLADIAEREQRATIDVVRTIIEQGGAAIVNFSMNEDEVRDIMQRPWMATASDGRADLPGADRPHPRLYGTFPRKIGHYAVREGVISLEAAIHSCTGLPADILGLSDAERFQLPPDGPQGSEPDLRLLPRGYLRPGFAADVVVFDPDELIDVATFEDPARYSRGIRYCWINGVIAIDRGEPTGALAGVALRHRARGE
ncbi:MAG: D-aminoacylase [Planctomyces sp.]|nr:D-aminoacylase [Planctomyces sp.]